MDMLISLMENDLLDFETVVKQGQAPPSIFLGLQPPSKFDNANHEFTALMGMSAMIRLYASMNQLSTRKNQNRSNPFSIDRPDEIIRAFAEEADVVAQTLTRGVLSNMYESEGGRVENMSPSLKRTEIHDFILKNILTELPQINGDILKKLDETLTHYIDLIRTHRLTPTPTNPTMNHSVVVNYIRTQDISGDGKVVLIDCFTRLVFIKVKAEDWIHATQKPGFLKRNEKIAFPLEITVTDLKLNKKAYANSKPKWEQIFQIVGSDSKVVQPVLDKGGIEEFGRQTSVILPMHWYLEDA